MATIGTGAAFVDRSGAIVAADRGFLGALGVDGADGGTSAALRARVEASPALRALVAGDGPAVARLDGPAGPVEVFRTAADGGALLVLSGCDAEQLEHAARSRALTRVAAGVAHDIKNPLNAMALQIALLAEKLGSAGEAASSTAAAHLGPLRDQIARVNEVVRRLLDVADPSAPLGFTDLGALALDAAALLSHDARRRRVEVALDAAPGVKTRCDPARVGRLVLALVHRALAGTPEGGRVAIRVEADHDDARVVLEHAGADLGAGLGYDCDVAEQGARALGGRLEIERGADGHRVVLTLPRNRRE
jgi:signal transduction histidine kinase